MFKKFTVLIFLLFFCLSFTWAQEAEPLPKDKEGNIEEPVKAPSIQDRIRAYEKSREFAALNEGFEDGVIPINWTVYNLDGDSYEWQAYSSTTYAHTGTYSARIHYNVSGNDDWLITPQLIIQAGVPDTLKFWARRYSTTYPEDFRILVSTTDNQVSSFTDVLLDTTLQALGIGTSHQQIAIPLDTYDGQNIYVAYHYDAVNDFYTYLDDFTGPEIYVPPIPVFTTPLSEIDLNVTNSLVPVGESASEYVYITNLGGADLNISTINTSTADIAVSPSTLTIPMGNTDSVLVTWTPSVVDIDTGWVEFIHDAASSPDTVDFYLQSVPAGSYVVDFEADVSTWLLPTGYFFSINSTLGYTSINNHWGSQGYWKSGTTGRDTTYLWSPRLDLTSGPAEVSFYYKGVTGGDDTVEVIVSTDNGLTWTQIGKVTNTGTNWRYQTYDLSAYAGNDNVRVGWHYYYPTGLTSGGSWYMDDVALPARYLAPTGVLYAIPDSVAFGSVPFGTSDTLEVVLSNIGSALNITSIISDNPVFSLAEIPTSIGALQNETFLAIFTPPAVGAVEAGTISITHDGVNGTEEVLTIPVTGSEPTVVSFPFTEAFENAGNIPDGWENDANDSGKDWEFDTDVTYGATQDHTTGTGYLGFVDDSTPNPTDPTNLLSPPMDISTLVNPHMDFYFWSFNERSTPQDTGYLHIDVWDGATWQLDVTDSIGQVAEEWRHARVSLGSYKSTATRVRFRVIETPSFYHDIGIDDVEIYDAIGWANLQWPPSTSTIVNTATENIYGQVWIDGVTNQPGVTPGLVAEVGFGPDASMPYDPLTGAANADWTWAAAAYNLDVGNNDEFMGTMTPTEEGTFDYAYRYSWNGSPWIYADQDGIGNGYDPSQAGSLTVTSLEGTQKLLLTEIVVTPTNGEFIEIYNPNPEEVVLSNYYITDATFAGDGSYYYNIVRDTLAGGGGFGDFHARFPDGATIQPEEYQTIALVGDSLFFEEYGVLPTYELFEDSTDFANDVPDMREAFTGSVNNQGGLTNGDEVVILYYWDGLSDLVKDVDYLLYNSGSPTANNEAVDKTGVRIDGPDADTDSSDYLPDTPIANQISAINHSGGSSVHRVDFSEGTQTQTGGNGITGGDETSENLDVTFTNNSSPSPNAAWRAANFALNTPRDLQADAGDAVVDLSWLPPLPFGELGYDDGTSESGFGFSATGEFAVRFTPNVYPSKLLGIKTYWANITGPLDAVEYSVLVNPAGGNNPPTSEIVPNTAYTVPVRGQFSEVDISAENIFITEGDFFFSWFQTDTINYGLGLDVSSPDAGRSWISFDGTSWSQLTALGYPYNLMIRAIVQEGTGENARIVELAPDAAPQVKSLAEIKRLRNQHNHNFLFANQLSGIVGDISEGLVNSFHYIEELIGFEVWRSEDSLTFTSVATTDTNTTVYSDNSVTNGTTYYYYVTATYDEGSSDPSNVVTAMPMGGPAEMVSDHVTPSFIGTITNEGNIGWLNQFPPAPGSGFQFNPATTAGQRLFEGAIMIATDSSHVSDAARTDAQVFDADFQFLTNIDSSLSSGNVTIYQTSYSDALAENPIGLDVIQTTVSADSADANNILIFQLDLSNTSGTNLTSVYAGGFFDWDVDPATANDRGQVVVDSMNTIAGVNNGNPFPIEVLEMHQGTGANSWMGVVPLSNNLFEGRRIAISADEVYPPNMTNGDKWTYMTMNRATNPNGDGGSAQDHAQVFGLPAVSIQSGGTARVGFAMVAGTSLQEIVDAARTAQRIWVENMGNTINVVVTGIGQPTAGIPTEYALYQNYPNPFNPTTTIKYDLKQTTDVSLTIYNMLGQVVRSLVNESQEAGYKQVVWDGLNEYGNRVASGVYIYRIEAGDFVKARKLILMK